MDVDVSRLSQELFFSKEAAAYLGISVQRLMKLTKDGKIKPLKIYFSLLTLLLIGFR